MRGWMGREKVGSLFLLLPLLLLPQSESINCAFDAPTVSDSGGGVGKR